MNIQEDYVNFETAKLLKEKGFGIKEETRGYYPIKGDATGRIMFGAEYHHNTSQVQIAAPTLQMAMKWLREEHNIHIELNWDKGNQLYSFNIWKPGKYQPEISSLDLWRIYKDDNHIGEWNYEEACEAAIKYCLENLI